MTKGLLAPSRTAALSLATGLVASCLAVFSSKVRGQEQTQPAVASSTAGADASTSPSSPSKKIFSSAIAEKTSVSVGDRVVVTYTAKLPPGATLTLDSLVTPAPEEGARPPGGAVLEFENPAPPSVTKTKTGDFFEWSQSVALFPFTAGTVRVPGPHYTFKENPSSPASPVDVRPPDLDLQVASRLPSDKKPEELAPKADRAIRLPAIPMKFWIALGAGVALVAGLVAWWIARRRRKRSAGAPEKPQIPAAEELLGEIARLSRLVESLGDDPRPFYTELTHAVKRYLERTTGDPVLEWTTFETVRRLRETGLELPGDVALPDLLSSADRVKFGKAGATRADAREALVRARRLHDHVEAREAARRAAEAAREKAS